VDLNEPKMKKNYFAENVDFILKNLMSSLVLSEISGVKQSTLSRIASGSSKSPYARTKNKIANAINISLEKLESQLITSKDISSINSIGVNTVLKWKENEDIKIDKFIGYLNQFRKIGFSLIVDEEHQNDLMPLGAKLEFICDLVFPSDIIIFQNALKLLSVARVHEVSREAIICSVLGEKQSLQIKEKQVLGVLKKINF
jgi:transcriptional regulator with XRE-family HTH domain